MSKRLMIGSLTAIMVLMLASCSLAINTVSLSTMFGGESENNGYNYDLNQWTLDLTVPLNNKLNICADLSNGEIDNGTEGDTFSYKIKGAYRVFADQKLRLALTGGIYHRDIEFPGWYDYTVSSLTVGMDGQLILNPKAWFDFGLAVGLLPDEKYANFNGDPSSVILGSLKFNYLFDKQFGLSVGYVSESYDSDLLNVGDNSHTGINAGVFFRF